MSSTDEGQSSSDESALSVEAEYAFPGLIRPRFGPNSSYPSLKCAFPLEPNHPLVAVWQATLKDKVMAEVRNVNGWRAVDVVRRGYSKIATDNPPEIVISVEGEYWSQQWRDVERDIREICVEVGHSHTQVSVNPSSVFPSYSSNPVYPYAGEITYNRIPHLGGSIGAAGSNKRGTLGGFFRLDADTSHARAVAVTCHHALSYSGEPICQNIVSDGDVLVHQPSDPDHARCMKHEIDILARRREGRANTLREVAMGELAEGDLDFKTRWMEEKSMTIEKLMGFDRHFGRVLATSGLRRGRNGGLVNWGLVEVVEWRKRSGNDLPFSEFCRGLNRITQSFQGTAPMNPGDVGLKYAGSTSYARGILSSIRSHYRSPSGIHGTFIETEEWCFVGMQERFVEDGEEGAWVVNRDGEVLGSVVGGNTACGMEIGYVAPIRDIMDDVMASVGGRVEVA